MHLCITGLLCSFALQLNFVALHCSFAPNLNLRVRVMARVRARVRARARVRVDRTLFQTICLVMVLCSSVVALVRSLCLTALLCSSTIWLLLCGFAL